MSDTDDEFRLSLVAFNLRTRRTSLIPQLHVDWESLRLRAEADPGPSASSEPTSPAALPLGPLPLPARQRGRSVLQGLAPSWINLERGGIQLPGGAVMRPTIQIRERGFKLELEWSW